MCSPSIRACHENPQRQNTQVSNTNSTRRRNNSNELTTPSEPPPSIAVVDDSVSHSTREAEIRTVQENHTIENTGMNNLVHGTERANSPQYSVNSVRKGIFEGKVSNALLRKTPSPQLDLTESQTGSFRDIISKIEHCFQAMPSATSPNVFLGEDCVQIEHEPCSTKNSKEHDDTSFLDASPIISLCPSSSVEKPHIFDFYFKNQDGKQDPSVEEFPSPRNVTQDVRLFKMPEILSPNVKSHPQASCHSQHNSLQAVSLAQMGPPISNFPKVSYASETREESSPISLTSTSPVTSYGDLTYSCGGQVGNDSSLSIKSHSHQSSHRIPFNLKPRPNSYQSQKHYQEHSTQWGRPTSYRVAPSRAFPSNMPHSGPHVQSLPSPALNGSPQVAIRTSPEILKTLLRKKACLYETGTSRAIALLTWLVARKLAFLHGYFSRQHLQSGVHAIVAGKISSGVITRTKVNRCMQVILNSCFYYIIPKPDGSEEKGNSFRKLFRCTATDDAHLIKTLAEPWNDLEINDEVLSGVSMKEEQEENDRRGSGGSHKRQVLLCFNENVRCAEDVINCHNDFIRDSAISANLILTPEEWRSFYLEKDEKEFLRLKGPLNSINQYLSFDMPSQLDQSLASKENIFILNGRKKDALGQLITAELLNFRTKFCCKRYEHDATLCRFAHVDVNKGWLRRNPAEYEYSPILCPQTTTINEEGNVLNGCYVNACKDGVLCKFAHSREEIDYHPKNYKTKECHLIKKGSPCPCDMHDICPNLHPYYPTSCSFIPPKSLMRYGGKRNNHTPYRIKGHLISEKHPSYIRTGAPMIYLSPAPISEFDKTLHFPGLHSLYRRNCATLYAHDVGSEKTKYSNFGDNCATAEQLSMFC